MRSLANVSFLVRGAIVALAIIIAGGLLSGLVGLSPEAPSVGAAPLAAAKKLHPTNNTGGINSVSVSGDIAVIGAFNDDEAGQNAGAVYIFQRDLGGVNNWGEVKKLTASDAQPDWNFGYKVAVSGDTVIVGMWDNLGSDGAAYIFQRDHGGPNNWGEVKRITSSDSLPADRFGKSLAMNGDIAIVGAAEHDGVGNISGAAYIFERNQGGADNWGEVKKLTSSDAEAIDAFGVSVAVSGLTAVVGATGETTGGTRAGAAYVFRRHQGGTNNWGEVTKLMASDAEPWDFFGHDVGVSGETAVVGMYDFLDPKEGVGAYVFQRDQGGADNWGEVRKITKSTAGDHFGRYVAVSGSTAVIGAPGGSYVFRMHQGGANNWGEVAQLTNGNRVAISGETVVVGGGTTGYVFNLPTKSTPTPCPTEGCSTPKPTVTPTHTPAAPSGVTKLVGSELQAYSNFSFRSAAVSGNTAVVGAPDAIGSDPGTAYVFQDDQGGAGNWGEVKKLIASDSHVGDAFGRSVGISGDAAIVGANGAGGQGAGAAYIYQRNQGGAGNWGEVKKLTASDAQPTDFLGHGAAISGDIAVVGAFGVDDQGDGAGAAYVFHRNQGGANNWGEVKKLTAPDPDPEVDPDGLAGDNFGYGVAVSGDTVFVATRYGEAAYLFQRDQGGLDNWGQVKKLTAPSGEFGIAIDGDTAIVGGQTARVYERDAGGADNWGEVTQLTGSGGSTSRFGYSVAVSGDLAVVGAYGDDSAGSDAGAAYAFQRNQGGPDNWGQMIKLTAYDAYLDDEFGQSVGVSGDTVVVGAHLEDEGGLQAGAAYIFDSVQPPPSPTPTPTPGPDTDGDGCSDLREGGPDETLGGMRDWLNPNDFYDVLGPGAALPVDSIIDLPNDILGVIQHFAPTGAPPYDVQFDRGPSSGPNAWNMTAPDGVIDLPNDILGVITQFNHSCV